MSRQRCEITVVINLWLWRIAAALIQGAHAEAHAEAPCCVLKEVTVFKSSRALCSERQPLHDTKAHDFHSCLSVMVG